MRAARYLGAVLALLLWPVLAWAQDAQEERDRGLIQAFLEDNLSAAGRDIRIEGFDGALSGRATIDTLTIADADGVWLTLRGAVLDWNRAALLSGRLEVAELSAEALIVDRAPQSGPDVPDPTARAPFALPELPVSIAIDRLALDRVTLGAPLLGFAAEFEVAGNAQLSGGEGAAELRLTRLDGPRGELSLTGSYSNETRNLALNISVDEAANGIAATLLNLPGQPALSLSIAGDGPIDDFRADIRLATDGVDRLSGNVALLTRQDDTAPAPTRIVTADLSGDIAPVFAPEYRRFFGDRIALRLRALQTPDGRQVLEDLQLSAQSIDLSGGGAIGADGWPERLDLLGRIADPQGGTVRLPTGETGTQLGEAQLRLRYDRAADDGWDLQLTASELEQGGTAIGALRLLAEGSIQPPDDGPGRVTGEVTMNATGLSLTDAGLSQALGPALSGRFGFDWSGPDGLRLRGIDLSGADYGLTGAVRLRLPDQAIDPLATLDLRLGAGDLGRFAAAAGVPLGGRATLDIDGTVAPVSGAIDLVLDGQTRDLAVGQPRLDPLLAGAGTLGLRLLRDTTATSVQSLRIATDHAEITGAATLGDDSGQFDVTAEIVDTALVAPGLSGPAQINAQGNGTDTAWDLRAKATLPGDASLDWQGRVTGLPDAPRLAGQVDAAVGSLAPYSGLAGRQMGGGIAAEAQIELGLTDLDGRIDLTATTRSPSVGIDIVDQILRGQGTLSAQLGRDADGRLSVQAARLSTPALNATVDGQMTGDSQSLTADLRLADGRILAPELAGPVTAQGTARRGSGDWQVDVTGTATGGTTLAAQGALAPDFARADLSLSGRLPLALANARLRPRAVTGTASYDLRLSGPLALSSLSGRISTQDARLTLPSLGLALGDINARTDLSGGRARIDATAAVSSGGRLAVKGGIGLAAPFNADLAVTAQEVALRQPRLYETTASGRVTLQGPLTGGARIQGAIDLGPAELRVPASSGPSFGDLAGLRHVNAPPEVRQVRRWAGLIQEQGQGRGAAGPAYPIDLVIRAPSRIFVRGRGLDAELGGQLRLRGTTANLVPQGRFELVRGRLDILGQRLGLDEGVLQLQGSFDPIIRFSATTQTEEVTVTLAIEGPASAPELVLSSAPELPQDEILSLLLFGRDVTEISAIQAVRLANAVRVLSGRGGAGLTGRLRESLALDDFDVTTDDDGNVEARAGKYLSENIYSDVTVNAEGETEINLNLEISPNVTVRGRLESDGDTGLGIYYERDY